MCRCDRDEGKCTHCLCQSAKIIEKEVVYLFLWRARYLASDAIMADNFGAKENCLLLLILESALANFLLSERVESCFYAVRSSEVIMS